MKEVKLDGQQNQISSDLIPHQEPSSTLNEGPFDPASLEARMTKFTLIRSLGRDKQQRIPVLKRASRRSNPLLSPDLCNDFTDADLSPCSYRHAPEPLLV